VRTAEILNPDLKIVLIKDAGTGPELNINWRDIGTGGAGNITRECGYEIFQTFE